MLRIGIIGSGRVGSALGAALRAAGHQVVGVTARSPQSRDRAERMLPGIMVRSATEVVDLAEVVLVAVPDDVIGAVAEELAADVRDGQYVVHLSGAHGLTVLDAVTARGAVPVALHPPMTFTGTPIDVERIPGVTFTATAPDDARPLVEGVVKDLGAGLQWVAEDQRAAYHAGIVHGSNHLVTLLSQAVDVLRSAGVTDPAATLRPLMTAMLDNALRSGHDALTGPIARGDVETVRAHLTALSGLPGETVPTYVVLARSTVEMVAADGRLDPGTAARLRTAIDNGLDVWLDRKAHDEGVVEP